MRRLTLALVKGPVARVLGICEDDPRVAQIVNEAQERLMAKGKWVGTTVRYRVCLTEGCITWPRQIETIEAFSICDCPGTVRNGWFEFLDAGPGQLKADSCNGNTLIDRGMSPVFDRIIGTNKKLRVYADEMESETAAIIVQGYDENDQWIRTAPDGIWIDGERIAIGTSGATSEHIFTSITGVIKDPTNGNVRLYEYDASTGGQRALGVYEPDETHPVYRVSLIPGLEHRGGCSDSTCERTTVTVVAKLRHMPVSSDNDWLILGNLGAIKLMAMAIRKEEQNLLDEAVVYEGKAVQLLEEELSTYQGDGVKIELRVQSDWIGDNVVNYI